MTKEIWTLQKLNQLIQDRVEEDFNREFKRADALKKTDKDKSEITKDVSSFANSGGGVIIYGIAESEEKPPYAEALDPVNPSMFSKEWLEQVIDGIMPKISGLDIIRVDLPGPNPGCAYVVVIPPSDTAHQAKDGRYYRRGLFKADFMRDYEIRDVMNRKKHPFVKVSFLWNIGPAGNHRLSFKVANNSKVMAKTVLLKLSIPVKNQGHYYLGHELKIVDNGEFTFIAYEWRNDSNPLFPGEISVFVLTPSSTNGENLYQSRPSSLKDLHCQVFADEMPFYEGNVNLADALDKWIEVPTP